MTAVESSEQIQDFYRRSWAHAMETACHAGHLDILREIIDGEAGRFADDPSVPGDDEIDWPAYVAKVEAAALAATNC